jgi:hypothetical protein
LSVYDGVPTESVVSEYARQKAEFTKKKRSQYEAESERQYQNYVLNDTFGDSKVMTKCEFINFGDYLDSAMEFEFKFIEPSESVMEEKVLSPVDLSVLKLVVFEVVDLFKKRKIYKKKRVIPVKSARQIAEEFAKHEIAVRNIKKDLKVKKNKEKRFVHRAKDNELKRNVRSDREIKNVRQSQEFFEGFNGKNETGAVKVVKVFKADVVVPRMPRAVFKAKIALKKAKTNVEKAAASAVWKSLHVERANYKKAMKGASQHQVGLSSLEVAKIAVKSAELPSEKAEARKSLRSLHKELGVKQVKKKKTTLHPGKARKLRKKAKNIVSESGYAFPSVHRPKESNVYWTFDKYMNLIDRFGKDRADYIVSKIDEASANFVAKSNTMSEKQFDDYLESFIQVFVHEDNVISSLQSAGVKVKDVEYKKFYTVILDHLENIFGSLIGNTRASFDVFIRCFPFKSLFNAGKYIRDELFSGLHTSILGFLNLLVGLYLANGIADRLLAVSNFIVLLGVKSESKAWRVVAETYNSGVQSEGFIEHADRFRHFLESVHNCEFGKSVKNLAITAAATKWFPGISMSSIKKISWQSSANVFS